MMVRATVKGSPGAMEETSDRNPPWSSSAKTEGFAPCKKSKSSCACRADEAARKERRERRIAFIKNEDVNTERFEESFHFKVILRL